MDSNLNRNSRIAMLVVALSLIGGTGCVHYLITQTTRELTPEQIAEDKRRFLARSEKEKKEGRMKRKAYLDDLIKRTSERDVDAQIQLGIEYLKVDVDLQRDVVKGISLIKNAADAGYPRGEYVYGWLLLQGAPKSLEEEIKLTVAEVERSPVKGVDMLARAASKSCYFPAEKMTGGYGIPAYDLISFFYQGRFVPQNLKLSELWLARSILHCGYDVEVTHTLPQKIQGYSYFSNVKNLAFLMLQDNPQSQASRQKFADRANKFAATLKPEEVAEAKVLAHELRQAVRQSEREYPDPANYKGKK